LAKEQEAEFGMLACSRISPWRQAVITLEHRFISACGRKYRTSIHIISGNMA